MKADRHIHFRRHLHGFPDKSGVSKRDPVIGKPAGPVTNHLLKVHQFLSAEVLRHGGHLLHMDRQFLRPLQNVIKDLRTIHHWLCICHADHRSKAAGCRRRTSGLQIFFIGKSRIPEMYVHIHQSRRHHAAACVNDLLRLSKVSLLTETGYLSILHPHIGHFIHAGGGIHYSSIFYKKHMDSPFSF